MAGYNTYLTQILVILLAGPFVASASAGLPAFDFGGGGNTTDRDGMVGFQFAVDREVTITDLGKVDANANGRLDDSVPPTVGIWDIIGQRLASATIDDSSTLDHGAFYVPISPLTLSPGDYVIGVQTFDEQEPYLTSPQASISLDAIELVEGRRARTQTSDFVFPVSRSSRTMFGPSFKTDELLAMFTPTPRAVYQRDARNMGQIQLSGVVSEQVDRVEARATVMDGYSGTSSSWQPIANTGGVVDDVLSVPAGGWYRIETRAYRGDELVGEHSVDQIGVGEVFITAGQSNSANHGSPRMVPRSELVLAMDAQGTWRHAADPQPVATGSGGSPWPALGDLLFEEFNVPIGFVSVGWGGTTVRQWLPGGTGPDADPLYDRLKNALDILGTSGARAILWHQGESDSAANTSTEQYAARLSEIVAQSRKDAGYDIPWLVAHVSFLPSTSKRSEDRIVAGQEQVIESDPLIFAGPLTDDLVGFDWRWDQVHFNEAGLRLHAQRWADAVHSIVVPEPSTGLLIALGLVSLLPFLRRGHAHFYA